MWLTADILVVVAESLDFKSYVRLMSACRLAHKSLSPKKASVVFPHAIRRIQALIRNERIATKDAEYTYERSIGNVLIYATPLDRGSRHKSYFQILVDDLDETKPTTITIIVNHRFFFPVADEEHNTPLDSVSAHITPSFENPLLSGTIKSDGWAGETVAYTDGFHRIVHELVCRMCPLKYDPRDA